MIKELLYKNPIYVFAIKEEASSEFNDLNTLFVGVGKINATYGLTKRIIEDKPSIIINLGSAGSNVFDRKSVVCCTKFIQRDMDATKIGCKIYETPFSNTELILNYGMEVKFLSNAICGTGDNFEVNHKETIYNVVDMEAYSLAYIAKKENIPFLCLKYISDGADGNAGEEWKETVLKAAKELRKVVNKIKR